MCACLCTTCIHSECPGALFTCSACLSNSSISFSWCRSLTLFSCFCFSHCSTCSMVSFSTDFFYIGQRKKGEEGRECGGYTTVVVVVAIVDHCKVRECTYIAPLTGEGRWCTRHCTHVHHNTGICNSMHSCYTLTPPTTPPTLTISSISLCSEVM